MIFALAAAFLRPNCFKHKIGQFDGRQLVVHDLSYLFAGLLFDKPRGYRAKMTCT